MSDRRTLLEAGAGYLGFCILGLISRITPVVFVFFVAYGIAFPLIWARMRKDWAAIGFTRRNALRAVGWGLLAGALWGAYTYAVFGSSDTLPPLWPVQIALGLPIWFLIMSPFQELFFRGWLQGRLRSVMGRGLSLVLTSVAFTLWHFFPDLESTATASLPLSSPVGIVSTFGAGLLFGYLYDREDSIIAPWLAHAVAGLALVLIGRMVFVQYVP